MLDRPELGKIVLEESLPDLIEIFCLRDVAFLRQIQKECEEFDPMFKQFLEIDSISITEELLVFIF